MKIVVMHDAEYIFVGLIKPFVEIKSDYVKFAMFVVANCFPIFNFRSKSFANYRYKTIFVDILNWSLSSSDKIIKATAPAII